MGDFVVLHAYGMDEVIDETRYCLLRQIALNRDIPQSYSYVVVTDRPAAFDLFDDSGLDLEVVERPLSRFREWRGGIDFVHRVKIEVLREVAATRTGRILYLDSDAYPRRDLHDLFESIDSNSFVMDRPDGVLDRRRNPEHWRWHRFVESHSVRLGGRDVRIPVGSEMWIAGVIGFPIESSRLLDEVLEMTEAIYPDFPGWNVEQFAFSYVLARAGTIHSSGDFVFHYWDLRGFRELVTLMFERHGDSLGRLVEVSGRILPERLYPVKQQFDAKRRFQWMWSRFPYRMNQVAARFGRSWDIMQFADLIPEGPQL